MLYEPGAGSFVFFGSFVVIFVVFVIFVSLPKS
jgi:hypothetical protein